MKPNTRRGPYEILAKLGESGMGEVYRAKDTRLGRTVAIKVLPPDLAADPERRRRFEQEARAVSALNHPHICVLYDIGSTPQPDAPPGAAPTEYLVMEHLEGQTVAERLQVIGRSHYAYAKLSPDKKWVAVQTFKRGTQENALALVATGAAEERLVTEFGPLALTSVNAWLPDGSAVLFTARKQVWRRAGQHLASTPPRPVEVGSDRLDRRREDTASREPPIECLAPAVSTGSSSARGAAPEGNPGAGRSCRVDGDFASAVQR